MVAPAPRSPVPPGRRDHRIVLLVAGALAVGGLTILAPLLRIFVVESFKVPAGSMLPTLEVGDQFFVWKLGSGRTPERGKVMVFTAPMESGEAYVKRVVALGGDQIEIRGGVLTLNGHPVPRNRVDAPPALQDFDHASGRWMPIQTSVYEEQLGDYVYETLEDVDPTQRAPDFGPFTVPRGHLFCMGDNRDHSFDSRAWGPVPEENLIGTPTTIWLSLGPDGVRSDRFGRAVNHRVR